MAQIPRPSGQGGNAYYVSNQPPLVPNPLIKLPTGAVRPRGWLRQQLELMARGFTGHLMEISPWCRAEGSAWMSATGEGDRGWEELPYWLKGFTSLAYVLGDEGLIQTAGTWIEGTLASQRPDGYFGPRANLDARDLWPNMIMLNVLQTFYEATGDDRVLPFMSRYFRWQLELPEEEFLPESWQKVRAGDNLQSVYWLYNRTGESWLLELGEKIHRRAANWTEGIASWHGVNICQGYREPAQYYQQSGDLAHLQASERNYQEVMRLYGQVPGGMFGADENCRPGRDDPRQAAETCSMVELMLSNELLLAITGDPVFADRCEEIAFNSLPASMTPDLRGLHYLTAPNMVLLDRHNKAPMLQNGGKMLAYDPWDYRCCQHNAGHGWPYFAEHLWMATHGNGLAAVFYCASEVEATVGDGAVVKIAEETDYPFGETVRLHISAPRSVKFPLLLRIPRWCDSARVAVNGQTLANTPEPSTYVVLDRIWQDGDVVTLELPMKVRLRIWERNHHSVSVDRGPLTYSLRIGERWERYGGTDEWPAFEVFPTTPWNYGLCLNPDDPAGSFVVERDPGPLPDQPFAVEAAPIRILAPARRIPQWQLENGLIAELQDSPAYTTEPVETVTLIPMGCARLRVSAFPVASDSPDAHRWHTPPIPPSASHCNPSDTTLALTDGQLPSSSADHGIPRFTWWDHLGSEEWVQLDFEAPRQVSWAEVYWFDDTGVGHCRVPARWWLLYREGGLWKPVQNPSGYTVEKDQFNRVTFDPVETDGLRLTVHLQPGFSGGILEWRVGSE